MNRYLNLIITACALLTAVAGVRLTAALAQTAAPQPTQITVTSGQNPSASNQSVIFTATVEGMLPNSGVPTGVVEFFAGPMPMGKATLVNSNGIATASVTVQMAPGYYPVLARYYGDTNFAFGLSMPPLTQQVLGQ